MKDYTQHFSNYTCPKCRSRVFYSEEVSLSSLPKKLRLQFNNNRYVAVTCELCGYTEFYSLKVLAKVKNEVPAVQPKPAAVEKAE